MNTCYKMEFNAKDNNYIVKPLGQNKNVDRKKINGVLQLHNSAWIAKSKQELIDHATSIIEERIAKHRKAIENLSEREIIS